MNKHLRIITCVSILFIFQLSYSQCTTGFLYVTGAAPLCNGTPQTIAGCQFAGEYSTVPLTAGTTYTFSSTVGTDYITVANAANVAQVWGTQPVNFTPAVSATFRIYTHGNAGCSTPGGCRDLRVTCTPGPPPPPANDNPCAAIVLTPAGSCFYSIYTNQSATATGGVPAPGCAGYSGGDVWFRVTVPASGQLNIDTQTGVMLDGGMAVYTGASCAALTLLSCDDNNSPNGAMPMLNLTGLIPGSNIWIRVWENGNNNNGTFGICVVDPTMPPPVMGTGAVYIGSNLGNPWGSTSNQTAMNTAFGAGGWTQAYFETVNPATTFVNANCFIFMEGGDFTATEMNTFITANMTAIQNWVAMGGRLIMNAAPNEGGNMNYGFGGVTLIYDGGTSLGWDGFASAGMAGHPIFNGPYLPAGTAYNGNYFAHSWISGGGTTSLIDDVPGPSLTEKVWGSGRVLFGGMTTSNWHTPMPNSDNLIANIIEYQSSCVVPLPVEMISFTGSCTQQGTDLKWQTASEINNAQFIIESSTDGINYQTESTITGSGNSNSMRDYAYISPKRNYPGTYFKLIQEDYDGTQTVYAPIYVSCHNQTNSNCALVNVSDGQIELSLYSAMDDLYHCTITDIQGKTIATKDQQVSKGTSYITFENTNLSAGVYVIVINGSNSQCSNKFMVH